MMSCGITIPALDNTMGALFVGVLLAAALWGISTMQAYMYYSTYYDSDSFRLKSLVFIVYVLDTGHQVMLSHLLYSYLVSNYGDPAYLDVLLWSILVMVLFSGLVAIIVQMFLCWRVWILSNRNIPLITFLLLVVFGSFGTTITYFAKSWSIKTFSKLPALGDISKAVNVLNFSADIFITLALVFFLRKSKSGMKSTDAIMNRLIYYCLQTGLITTFCAVASLISISIWPNTFIYITFYCALARLYTNSFYATLNARENLRASTRAPQNSFITSLHFNHPWAQGDELPVNAPHHAITIKQDVETEIHRDYDTIELGELQEVEELNSAVPVKM